jgi:hypothetical protein
MRQLKRRLNIEDTYVPLVEDVRQTSTRLLLMCVPLLLANGQKPETIEQHMNVPTYHVSWY